MMSAMANSSSQKPPTNFVSPWLRSALVGLFLPALFVVAILVVGRSLPCYGWACLGTFGLGVLVSFAVSIVLSIAVLRAVKAASPVATTVVGLSAFYAGYSYYSTVLNSESSISGVGAISMFALLGAVAYGFLGAVLPRLSRNGSIASSVTLTLAFIFAGTFVDQHPALYNPHITSDSTSPTPTPLYDHYAPKYIPLDYRQGGVVGGSSFDERFSFPSSDRMSTIVMTIAVSAKPLSAVCASRVGQTCRVEGQMADGSPIYSFQPYHGEVIAEVGGSEEVDITQNGTFLPPAELVKIARSLVRI